jgi:hypothetical protein
MNTESKHPELIVRAKSAPYIIVLLRMVIKELDNLTSKFKDRMYFHWSPDIFIPPKTTISSLFNGDTMIDGSFSVTTKYAELQLDVEKILFLLTRVGVAVWEDSFLGKYIQWCVMLDGELEARERMLEAELDNVRMLRRAEAAEKNKMKELLSRLGEIAIGNDPVLVLHDLLGWKDPHLIEYLRDQGRDHSEEAIKSLEQGRTG